jgi:hypothetical protein
MQLGTKMTDYIKIYQHLENVILAQEMWATVPVENVQLNNWQTTDVVDTPNCGTIACFGGWCALYPAFRAKGVYVGPSMGMPEIDNGTRIIIGTGVAQELFGDYDLFSCARGLDSGTDHEIVSRRLSVQRERLEIHLRK